MAQELISDIVLKQAFDQVLKLTNDVETLYQRFKLLTEQVLVLNESIGKGGANGGGFGGAAKGLSELEKVKRDIVVTQEKLNAAETLYGQLLSEQKLALSDAKKANTDFVKSKQAASGSIDAMELSMKALNKEIRALGDVEGANAAKVAKLKEEYNKLDAVVRKHEQSMGNYRKSVGHYTTAFNGLSTGISRVARELPNFAQSMQIGIMSLTNNIGGLIDGVNQIKAQNKVLAAGGKATQSVMKQVGLALASWNTLIMIGVTLITAFGDELGSFVMELVKGKDVFEEFTKLSKEVNAEMSKQALNMSNETAHAKMLIEQVNNVNLTNKERGKAYDELNRLYPDLLSNMTKEDALNGGLVESYEGLLIAIEKTALMRAKYSVLDSVLAKLESVKNEIKALTNNEDGTFRYFRSDILENLKGQLQLLEQRADFIREDIKHTALLNEDLQKDSLGGSKSSGIKLPDNKNGSSTNKSKETNQIEELKKLYEQEQYIINEAYRNRTISEEVYYATSSDLAQRFYDKRKGLSKNETESEIKFNEELSKADYDYYNKLLDLLEKSGEENAKIEAEKLRKYIEYQRIKLKATKEANEQELEWAKGLLDSMQRMWDEADEDKRKQVEALKDLFGALNELEASFFNLASERIKAKSEAELKAVDEKESRELEALSRLTLADKEREERRKNIELAAESRRKQIHNEEVRRLRRMAIMQRSIDTVKVVANTAKAVTEHMGDQPAYLAAIRVAADIAMGAAQLMNIHSQPLPQYAKGVKSKPKDGLAMVGEKGIELVTLPTGEKFLTPNESTIMNLPARTRVDSHQDLMKMVYEQAIKNMGTGKHIVHDTNTMQVAMLQAFDELSTDVKDLKKTLINKQMAIYIENNVGHIDHINKAFG